MEENHQKQNELAQKRTDLAVQRTILANARTFSAWVRTGLSCVLGGLAIVKFLDDAETIRGFVLITGLLFVTIGIAVYVLALISFKKSNDELKQEGLSIAMSMHYLYAITAGLILSAVLIGGILFTN